MNMAKTKCSNYKFQSDSIMKFIIELDIFILD